jgi:hypothetical protein
MKAWGILFVLGTMPFCAFAAHAADCQMRVSNLDNFARFRVGQPIKVLPKGVKRAPNCTVYRKYHTFDCGFTDPDGNSYIASGHGISRVDRELGASSFPLPSPLVPGMSMEEAVKVLSAANPTMKLIRNYSETGGSLTTPECLKNRYGSYYLSLGFDKAGRMNGLSAGLNTAEN